MIRKTIATIFLLTSLILGIIFYQQLSLPSTLQGYFHSSYYNQLGGLAICVELLFAGYYLAVKHSKANFTLALFAFTALLDPLFNVLGIFNSQIPLYALLIFIACALVALWISFSNAFGLGRISLLGAFGSFLLGTAIELFFNYL